jgi:membrane fusion protein, multidrug efflux system
MKIKKNTFFTLIFLCLAGIALLIMFYPEKTDNNSNASSKPKEIPLVKAVLAKKSQMLKKLELTGSVQAFRIAKLASPAEGPILNLKVREGDIVDSGTVLMSIGRKKGIDALILSLQEELNRDKEEYGRVKQLVEKAIYPTKNLESARATFEMAKARLAAAEQELQDYSIKAPWTGTVSAVKVQDGDFVLPRSPLIEIYDPTSLIIRAAVPERNAADLKLTMGVDVSLDAYPAQKFKGEISRVYPYLDQRLRTRTIEVEIKDPPVLLPGMFARLGLVLGRIDNAIMVPADALLTSPKGDKMMVLLKEGKALRRKVVTGIEDSGFIQIVSGLSEGEEVIVEGNEKLKDGAEVRLPGQKAKEADKQAGNTKQKTEKEQGDQNKK